MFPPQKKTSPRSHPVVHPKQTNKQTKRVSSLQPTVRHWKKGHPKRKCHLHQFTAWWWFQPIRKSLVKLDHFPQGEHQKYVKPPSYITFREVMSVSAASGIHGHGPFGICAMTEQDRWLLLSDSWPLLYLYMLLSYWEGNFSGGVLYSWKQTKFWLNVECLCFFPQGRLKQKKCTLVDYSSGHKNQASLVGTGSCSFLFLEDPSR